MWETLPTHMTTAAPFATSFGRPRPRPSTIDVTYDLAMTHDGPSAAARIAQRDLATSQLLSLAAEFDAAGSPAMASHARRVAREMEAQR